MAAVFGFPLLALAALSCVGAFDPAGILLALGGVPLLALAYTHSRRIGIDEETVYEKRTFRNTKRIRFEDISRTRYRCLFGRWVLYSPTCRIVCPLEIDASGEMMEMLCARVPDKALEPLDTGEGFVVRTCPFLYGTRVGGAAVGWVSLAGIASNRILHGAQRLDDEAIILVLFSAAMLAAFILQLLYLPMQYVFGKDEIRVTTALRRRDIPTKTVHSLSIEMRKGPRASYRRALMVRFFPMSGEKHLELAERRVNLPLQLILRRLREQYGRDWGRPAAVAFRNIGQDCRIDRMSGSRVPCCGRCVPWLGRERPGGQPLIARMTRRPDPASSPPHFAYPRPSASSAAETETAAKEVGFCGCRFSPVNGTDKRPFRSSPSCVS